MITFNEAQRIAQNEIPDGHVIIEDLTEAIDLGWYFMHQTKLYVETGQMEQMAVGHSGIVVCRANGKVLSLGSAESKEYWFQVFRWGLHEPCDLTVIAVRHPAEAANLLARLQMSYVIPEEDNGTVWRIPQSYTHEIIRRILQSLPCTFEAQNLVFRLRELEAMRQTDALSFTLSISDAQQSNPADGGQPPASRPSAHNG